MSEIVKASGRASEWLKNGVNYIECTRWMPVPEHGTHNEETFRCYSIGIQFSFTHRCWAKWMGAARWRIHYIRVKYLCILKAHTPPSAHMAHNVRCSISTMCARCADTNHYIPICRALNDILIQTIMQLKSNRGMKASIHKGFRFVREREVAPAPHTHFVVSSENLSRSRHARHISL